MKIGIFTDSHYSSADITCGCRYNNQSLRKIREAYDFFEKANCDLVVCLGDLIDTELTIEQEIAKAEEVLCNQGEVDADFYTKYENNKQLLNEKMQRWEELQTMLD